MSVKRRWCTVGSSRGDQEAGDGQKARDRGEELHVKYDADY